ncbi:hypothetical protein B0T22DRAFT_448965 [Podospora appendiculata]|uniref:SMP-30/Gluconolactonase/LRE-like region domain-containing protein n=1 Tax=Podospora appendiculata TaxID=314037 RepID=A0AAE0XGT9_9PEZI|nr:hypothetical protein B0T22DRAFT_448965 [Podospora appendiculata]
MFPTTILTRGLIAALLASSPALSSHNNPTSLPLPTRAIAQFPVGTWVENIAVRSNGDLLVTTLFTNASLYTIANPSSRSPSVTRLFTVGAAPSAGSIAGLLGITEVTHDYFAFINIDLATNTQGIWGIDFTNHDPHSPPSPHLIVSFPNSSGLPNGATTLPGSDRIIFVADSGLGLIWRVDVVAKTLSVALQVPETNHAGPVPASIGANGVHVRDGYLYWTNTEQVALYRVKITRQGWPVTNAAVETVKVFAGAGGVDDFTFGPRDRDVAWVLTPVENTLVAVGLGTWSGRSVAVAGSVNSSAVAKGTAAQFGRTPRDAEVLYVVTGGDSVQGEEGGKVVAVDTAGFRF